MKMIYPLAAVVIAALAAFAAVSYAGDDSTGATDHSMHSQSASVGVGGKAADLRVKLDRLLGEHAVLAITATRKGFDGDADFNRAAATLDRNSIELANTIGSVYGTRARNEFLDGRFKWRAHIGFFVDYTVALKKSDEAGKRKAVDNLMGYIGSFSAFLAKATNLPPKAVRASITEHVGHLKGQIDAYAARDYARAYRLERVGYRHMFVTGDTLAAAIVKQYPRRFR